MPRDFEQSKEKNKNNTTIYFFEDDYKKSIVDLSNKLNIDTENLLETIENIIDRTLKVY